MSPGRIARGAMRRARARLAALVGRLPFRVTRPLVRLWLEGVGVQPDARRAMRALLEVHQDAYDQVDLAAIRYDGGVHAKHRLTRYHDFFVGAVRAGERVLDVGCGKGELAHDLVERAGAEVLGIDHNPYSLSFARQRYARPGLRFEEMDILERLPAERFDSVVLSNVLEHFPERIALLRRILEAARPDRVLIRVPVLARDWTVPLRQELGLRHFSDETHFVEYDAAGFTVELAEAGLETETLEITWGEIWSIARPAA